MNLSLHGMWTARIGDGSEYPMQLPGTLDENQIGHADVNSKPWHPDAALGNDEEVFRSDVIATRFTRRYTYEGQACLTRTLEESHWNALEPEVAGGKRIFLEAERARVLRLLIDGEEIPDFIEPSISTRHVFEVTGHLKRDCEMTLLSDNRYPGLPYDDIVSSSAATDETQTNWNGVLGELCLRTEEGAFLGDIRVYPKADTLTVKMNLYTNAPYRGEIVVHSEVLKQDGVLQVDTSEAVTPLVFASLPLKENVQHWDLEEGNLYELSAAMTDGETKRVDFGVRAFGYNGKGRLTINGRIFFLRGEANCGEFPESGHHPMSVDVWLDILKRYRSYGVNCVRFHSHCPPEAAFTAADRLGMLMQPELSCWNPKDAFGSEESCSYYETELVQILHMLANHPSFVMLSLGNELQASPEGHERMRRLLQLAREIDPTRLYTDSSNGHYGALGCEPEADFYTSANFYDQMLRGTSANMEGHINNVYPNAQTNYDPVMEALRREYTKPVFGFEVGQFEVLPDFGELEEFHGISDPANLRLIKSRVEQRGMAKDWKKYVEATGELSRIAYREEVEAVMRTGEMSGISLLGLQDFPGQGTALVGMMNSHLQPKPYAFARPEHFQTFFRDRLPLVLLPKYTWENTEKLTAQVRFANYGKTDISGVLEYELRESAKAGRSYFRTVGEDDVILFKGKLEGTYCPAGTVTNAGILKLELEALGCTKPLRLNLIVKIGEHSNLYPIWVYPKVTPVCPNGIYESRYLDERAKEILQAGGKVYLAPPSAKEVLPESIQAQFTTDFWSVGTFAGQEGGMGQLINDRHPLFDHFPTEFHTNWQWWPMARQRAVILPEPLEAIITELDSYAFLRPMAQLLECRCGGGRLLFSSMGLQDLQQYPEARALLEAIYRYMDSESFAPKQEISIELWEQLVYGSIQEIPTGKVEENE